MPILDSGGHLSSRMVGQRRGDLASLSLSLSLSHTLYPFPTSYRSAVFLSLPDCFCSLWWCRSRGLAILMKKGGDEGGKGLEVGRDRGSSGQKRRDIRVYLGGAGGEGGLTVGTSVMLSDDQNHYLRERRSPASHPIYHKMPHRPRDFPSSHPSAFATHLRPSTEAPRPAGKVMRVRDGGEVKVFDGVSGEFWCELESQGTGLITERRREVGAEKLVDVWVLVSALKGPGGGGGHMEIVAQKATELGATRIVVSRPSR